MKDINFKKVGMENFACYTELMEYEFQDDKIIMITGPNGAGKSTIFECLPVTIFGSGTKGIRSDELVNNETGKNCHTFVEFTSIEEPEIVNSYRVDRYINHSKFGDTVLLFKNGELKPYKKGQKEVLPEIEKLLIPQKLFNNTLLFGQKVKDFFTDLTESEKKDIFRKVLQLDDYVLFYDETTKRIKILKFNLDELEKSVSLNSSLLIDANSQILLLHDKIKKHEDEKRQEIAELTRLITNLNIELRELSEKRNLYKDINDNTMIELSQEISIIQNEINNIISDQNNLLKSLVDSRSLKESEFNSKFSNFISEKRLKNIESISKVNSDFQEYKSEMQIIINELSNVKSDHNKAITINNKQFEKNIPEILKLETSLNKSESVCPTCGKKLTDDSVKNHLLNELNNLVNSNETLNLDNIKHNTTIKEAYKKLEEVENLIKKSKSEIDLSISTFEEEFNKNLKETKQKLDNAIKILNDTFENKKSGIEKEFSLKKNTYTDKINNLIIKKDKLIKLLDEKKSIDDKMQEIKINITSSENSISQKENEEFNNDILENYINKKDILEKEKECFVEEKNKIIEILEILNFWKQGFSSSGIPSLLIDESIPFLNSSVSSYLEMIGNRYIVSFDTLSTTKSGEYRDKINVNVLDTKTKADNRKQLSGGQTRIIDIAILLSLCDLQNEVQNMKTNILLLDEVFDSLDDENIAYVSSLLRSMIKGKSINIISHRHIDSIETDEVIRLF